MSLEGALKALVDKTLVRLLRYVRDRVSPAEEPSAKTLQAVARFVRDHGVTTIFSEDTLPADLARTVADETGARTATLDTLESLLDEDYVSLMTANLDAIRAALECS